MSRSQTTAPGCWSPHLAARADQGQGPPRPVVQAGRPVDELRKWYSHDPERFEAFGRPYREELQDAEPAQPLKHLQELARSGTLTLLTATKHAEISEAAVLADVLRG
jgi:uncharacterized protein YeaO (DUF488 family)